MSPFLPQDNKVTFYIVSNQGDGLETYNLDWRDDGDGKCDGAEARMKPNIIDLTSYNISILHLTILQSYFLKS